MDRARRPHITALAASNTFSHLSEQTLGRLAAGTTESTFKRGSVVFGRGSPATGIHIVASGQLKLCIETPQGDEHVMEILREGDCFGEAAMLSNRLHQVTAAAVSDCRVLHVARNTLVTELEHDRQLASRILLNLSDRLYKRTSDLENVLFRKAVGRVARFILELKDDQRNADAKEVQLPAPKGVIASRLNMTQEHFSRTLRELSQHGHIAVHRENIEIINEGGMRALAA